MKFDLKKAFLVFALQLMCGMTFAQSCPEPPASSEPKQVAAPVQEGVIYEIVDEQAEFPGGKEVMFKYLKDNLKYPEIAEEMGIEGKCYLKFIVSARGEVSNVKIMRGVTDCPECDKEAIRLVKGMPKWKSGKINGKDVNSYYTLPVTFRLQ